MNNNLYNSLKDEVKSFKAVTNGGWEERNFQSDKLQKNLGRVKIIDSATKIGFRVLLSVFFGGLLVFQNQWVFNTITSAMYTNRLMNLQPIFSVVVSGTLLETYYIARIIVRWVFTDIDYTMSKDEA